MKTLSFPTQCLCAAVIIHCLLVEEAYSRRLQTVASPEIPVVDGTCVLSAAPEDTDVFVYPVMKITKGSATFMGRVDSCFGWQVNGTDKGEVRTQMLCGGGKPAADQFCRNNDYSRAGTFQVSFSFLAQTFAVQDFKICSQQSCLGFESIQCETWQSESEVATVSWEAAAPAPSPVQSPEASSGTANLYDVSESAFCYNDGYGNEGCFNIGNNNRGDHNLGDNNMGSYNNGSYNNGTGNLGNFNQGLNNSGLYNNGIYNSGTGNNGTYNQGVNNTGNFNEGIANAGTYNQGNVNNGELNAGSQNNGVGNQGNQNNGTWNAGNYIYGNNNRGDNITGNNQTG